MGAPIKKTAGHPKAKINKTQNIEPKKREYVVTPDGRKVDATSTFEGIEKEHQKDVKKHDKIIKELIEGEASAKPGKTKKTNGKGKPKKRVYSVTPDGRKVDITDVFDQIEKNTEQDKKDQQKFMQDMFGDVL